MIGLDALDPFFLEQFQAELPVFSELKKTCEWHLCLHADDEEPNTATGWSTIYTGKLSSEHGITGWGGKERKQWLGLANRLEGKFWDRLNVARLSVGLLNPPLVWPAWDGDRWCVAGFPDPLVWESGEYNGLYSSKEIGELAPSGYMVDPADRKREVVTHEDWRDWFLLESKALARIRLAYAIRLFRTLPVDVGFACFTFLDRLGHGCSYLLNSEAHYGIPNGMEKNEAMEEMLRGYRLCDRIVSELLDSINPEAFIICADHGFNFSDVTPTLDELANKITGHPNWISHTWKTIGFAGGAGTVQGQGADTDLRWVFDEIFRRLNISVPDVEKQEDKSAFDSEEEATVRGRLEALGYSI